MEILTHRKNIGVSGEMRIPIIVDSVKQFQRTSATRCTYFSIEITAPDIEVRESTSDYTPYAIVNLSGIIWKFQTSDGLAKEGKDIERIFSMYDDKSHVSIEMNSIWIPTKYLSIDNMPPRRGDVFRFKFDKFIQAIQHNINIPDAEYEDVNIYDDIHPSHIETQAFRQWQITLIEDVKTYHHAITDKSLFLQRVKL